MKQKNGIFIAFEGPEGCGKTTQLNYFTDYLKQKHLPFVLTREPGGTKIGEQIRTILLDPKNKKMSAETEAYLYAASRAQLIREFIIPQLKENKIVITDRYVDSSLIYQGIGRNLGLKKIKNLNRLATLNFFPHITFILLIEPKIGLSRAKKMSQKEGYKNGDRLENENFDFHQRIYNGFKTLYKYRKNLFYLDSSQSIEDVKIHLLEIFNTYMELKTHPLNSDLWSGIIKINDFSLSLLNDFEYHKIEYFIEILNYYFANNLEKTLKKFHLPKNTLDIILTTIKRSGNLLNLLFLKDK